MFNLSIHAKFTLLFLLVVAMLGAAAYRIMQNVYRTQITTHASTVADDVTHFGRWVAKYGRVWVTTSGNSYLGKKDLVDIEALLASGGSLSDQDALSSFTTTYYSKNPALAQREFSEVAASSDAPAKFRMTSLNYMNPANKPDAFESEALNKLIGSDLTVVEKFDLDYNEYRYARKIVMKEGCIACHGDPKTAPNDVITRYGNKRGFGFKAGDVAGIISVTLPLESFQEMLKKYVDWKDLLLILGAFILALVFLEYRILKPLKRLAVSANKASIGEDPELDLDEINAKTHDEIQQLGLAIKRLHTSMRIAIEQMKGKR